LSVSLLSEITPVSAPQAACVWASKVLASKVVAVENGVAQNLLKGAPRGRMRVGEQGAGQQGGGSVMCKEGGDKGALGASQAIPPPPGTPVPHVHTNGSQWQVIGPITQPCLQEAFVEFV